MDLGVLNQNVYDVWITSYQECLFLVCTWWQMSLSTPVCALQQRMLMLLIWQNGWIWELLPENTVSSEHHLQLQTGENGSEWQLDSIVVTVKATGSFSACLLPCLLIKTHFLQSYYQQPAVTQEGDHASLIHYAALHAKTNETHTRLRLVRISS